MHGGRTSFLVGALVAALLASNWPANARAEDVDTRNRFVLGASLTSAGGVGLLVGGVGSVALMVHSEYTGFWGWLSLVAGPVTFAGGLLMANNERRAVPGGISAMAAGSLSFAIGVAGLLLQSPKARARRPALSPLVSFGAGDDAIPMLGIHGIF